MEFWCEYMSVYEIMDRYLYLILPCGDGIIGVPGPGGPPPGGPYNIRFALIFI